MSFTSPKEPEWTLGEIGRADKVRFDGSSAVYLLHQHEGEVFVAQAEKIETERFWCPRCFEFAPKHIAVLAHMVGAIVDQGYLGEEKKETKLREE